MTGNSWHKIMLPQCFSNATSLCHNRAFLQSLSASPQFLFQCSYCYSVDVAYNALQHYRNMYYHNVETHCRNAPFVTLLQQCCYCKGHSDNAFWYCRNTPTFSISILIKNLMFAVQSITLLCSGVFGVHTWCEMAV